MNNTIPSAEEFINLNIKTNEYPITMDVAKKLLVDFAKLHVQAALKEAYMKSRINCYKGALREELMVRDIESETIFWASISENSIKNSYPLTNIK